MNADDAFEKYPFLKKACEEQEYIARFLGGSLPPAYKEAVAKIAGLAEDLLDGTPEEKEAVMVGCVLTMASPFTFDSITRFETEYSPRIKGIVDSILGSDEQKRLENAPQQQIESIMALFMMDAAIQGGIEKGAVNKKGLTSLKQETLDQLPLLEETAPRLYAALGKTLDEFISEAGKSEPANKKPGSKSGSLAPRPA